jgi:serine/threonine protein kinase
VAPDKLGEAHGRDPRGEIRFPEPISDDANHLILGLLRRNLDQRMAWDAILEHQWLKDVLIPLQSERPGRSSHFSARCVPERGRQLPQCVPTSIPGAKGPLRIRLRISLAQSDHSFVRLSGPRPLPIIERIQNRMNTGLKVLV